MGRSPLVDLRGPRRFGATNEVEASRIAELHRLQILDSGRDHQFDRIVRAAAAMYEVPISLVSLVDVSRQWFKAAHGIDVPETPRDVSFCSHAILQPGSVLIVPDARDDERFARTPLVTGAPHIRFYAGAPLVTSSGAALGTVCVIDRKPRELSGKEARALEEFAALAARLIEVRACGTSVASLNRLLCREAA